MPLGDLTDKIRDGVHRRPNYVTSGVPFLTVRNLTATDSITLDGCRFISADDHRSLRRRTDPRPGDVLVSKDGTLGVARLVPEDFPEFNIFVSIAQRRVRRDLILPELVRAFFDSPFFGRQLGRLSAGSGLRHIHLSHFRRFVLPVPPLGEQRRIADRLAVLDRLVGREDEHLEQSRRVKDGLAHEFFAGRLRGRA